MIPTRGWRMFCKSLGVTMLLGWTLAAPAAAADAAGFKETVVYSFCGQPSCPDGENPTAGLIEANGTLYGTTISGGLYGLGVAFAFDPTTGAETVLYSFCSHQNCTDGAVPNSSLTDVKGTFYGSTLYGGANHTCGYNHKQRCGTVFAFDPITGVERVIYSFCSQQNCADGASPNGGLIKVGGMLYGTTLNGGSSNNGTLFSIDRTAGAETVVHSFASGKDGSYPQGNLIELNGVLYGITSGGANGRGTVFSFDPETGSETTVYSFCSQQNCADGATPLAGLIHVNGILYGTTDDGGTGYAGLHYGTVFALDPATGVETVLYSFCSQQDCRDGASPLASLIDVKGTLYGTTVAGGNSCGTCGTVFSLDLSTHSEAVVYNFCSELHCTDGWSPKANLLEVNGTLYSTTSSGGPHCRTYSGCGTLFSLKKL